MSIVAAHLAAACSSLYLTIQLSTFQDRNGEGTPTCSDGYLKLYPFLPSEKLGCLENQEGHPELKPMCTSIKIGFIDKLN